MKKESIFFAEEKEKEGGKYLVKENMFFFVEEKKNREGIEETVWRRKIYFLRRSFWNTDFGNTDRVGMVK